MKKIVVMLLTVLFFTGFVFAQDDKTPKRPADMGDGEFDSFKNTSFNIVDESASLRKNLEHIDTEIKTYSGVMSTVSTEKLKGHYKALTGVKKEVETLNTNIGALDEKGKDMVTNAANVTPKTKSIKATSNTKKSVEGLDFAKGNIKSITSMLQEDMKLVGDELKSRGEPIE